MSTETKAIIFDLGRVIVNIHIERGIFGQLTSRHNGEQVEQLLLRLMSEELIWLECCGKIQPEEFHRQLCDKYQLDFDYHQFVELWVNIFTPIEGIPQLIDELRSHYPLGLLSDTDILHWEHILQLCPFLTRFENPTLSYQVGVTKPDPLIYQRAAENVGFPLEQCLFIDDMPRNVEGARACGMQAIQFTGLEALKAELARHGLYRIA